MEEMSDDMGLLALVLAQATFFVYPFPLDSLGKSR